MACEGTTQNPSSPKMVGGLGEWDTISHRQEDLHLAFEEIDILDLLTDSLGLIARETWQAKPPTGLMHSHDLELITIHHSATLVADDVDPLQKMKSLQQFSQSASTLANGRKKEAWADVPYHFVIFPQGQVAEGRKIAYAGDTNTEYDPKGHILINLEGNYEEQQPNALQLATLQKLCFILCAKYQLTVEEIGAHRDFAKTLCPGKNLADKIPALQTSVAHLLQKNAKLNQFPSK